MVNQYNLRYLEQLESPTFIIKVIDMPDSTKYIEYTDIGNLYSKFTYVKGSIVIFTENLQIEVSLIDGSIGTVIDIIQDSDQMYNIYLKAGDPPFVIIVHFDCYRGSSYFEDLDYPDIEDSEYIVPTIQSI